MKRRRLGQHYLIDGLVVERMVKLAEIGPGDRVLEIGTGRGVLTSRLAGLGAAFEGYEVDPENHRLTLEAAKGARVHLADAFLAEPEFDVLVSSLPYSESAAFVDWLAQREFRRAVVLLQSDFVVKITAPPGTRDYRSVSAISQISTAATMVSKVGRDAFAPPPRVSSAIVVMAPKRRMTLSQISLVKKLFSLRRRTIASATKTLGTGTPAGYDLGRRVRSLNPDEVWELCLRWAR